MTSIFRQSKIISSRYFLDIVNQFRCNFVITFMSGLRYTWSMPLPRLVQQLVFCTAIAQIQGVLLKGFFCNMIFYIVDYHFLTENYVFYHMY